MKNDNVNKLLRSAVCEGYESEVARELAHLAENGETIMVYGQDCIVIRGEEETLIVVLSEEGSDEVASADNLPGDFPPEFGVALEKALDARSNHG